MDHSYYMNEALKEAQIAYDKNEVPIGAVIVKDGKIIARAHNLRESLNKAISHAETLAIEQANNVTESWRLDTCTLYVTIEPCPMCAGAILQSRIKTLVYGAKDPKAGVHESMLNLFDYPFNHKVEIISGILEEECANIMKRFFKKLRQK